jgi:hypothetical protein
MSKLFPRERSKEKWGNTKRDMQFQWKNKTSHSLSLGLYGNPPAYGALRVAHQAPTVVYK